MRQSIRITALLVLSGVICSTVNSYTYTYNGPFASSSGSSSSGSGSTNDSTSKAEFSNGHSFDVNSLVSELNGITTGEVAASESTLEQELFGAADVLLQEDPGHQALQTQFSVASGNEFVSSENVSGTAEVNTEQLALLVDNTGIDTAESFDVNGNPTDNGVMMVSTAANTSCPYDEVNAMQCMDQFREASGSCTNVMDGRKTWGMSMTPYTRVLAAAYEDGIGERVTRESFSRNLLKSPRVVSLAVTTTDIVLNLDGFNLQIMQWGQFFAHEMTQLAPLSANESCCPDIVFQSRFGDLEPTLQQLEQIREEIARLRGDICQQIENENDEVYGGYVCMQHTRSSQAPLHNCAVGLRQQMNAATHLIDASAIYGSSEESQAALRDSTGGRMRTQTVNGHILPPSSTARCSAQQQTANRCPFTAGDSRINTTPNLISTHTVFLIKHNQIADKLSTLNPHWDHERLFQEARRIIGGIQANIHYYEYLPLIVGSNMLKRYNIDKYQGHDPEVNPSVLNELAHAAFRFGHSTVGGVFNVFKDESPSDAVPNELVTNFNNPNLIYDGGISQCVRGLISDVPWVVDRNFANAMRNSLFNSQTDIVSFNINRGRDHGFHSYVQYRSHYGLSVPRTFDDLVSTHPQHVIDSLRTVYTDVADVELYVGGVTEKPVSGGLVGELFANIIAEGFSNLQKGDRFYFENTKQGLTPEQVKSIRDYKYHQLLCDTTSLESITDNAFKRAGHLGASNVTCSSLPDLDLFPWQEPTNSPPKCEWQTTSESECCLGARNVRRTCVGDSNCVCLGPSVIKESCKCPLSCWTHMWYNCKDFWRNRHYK